MRSLYQPCREAAGARARRPFLALAISLAALVALGACSSSDTSSSSGSSSGGSASTGSASGAGAALTVADKNAFTEPASQCIDLQNQITQAINSAASGGDFSGIDATTGPLFTQLEQQVGNMEQHASKLSGQASTVAGQAIALVKRWTTSAQAAIAAAKADPQSPDYTTNAQAMQTAASELNAKMAEWNAIPTS